MIDKFGCIPMFLNLSYFLLMDCGIDWYFDYVNRLIYIGGDSEV